jgi:photosystem II stability/assembly factor-like uncharacterized protein
MSIVIATALRSLAAVVTAASLLAGLQLAQAATARADKVVGALAYAPQAEALYKTDDQGIYRSESGGKEWTKVALPLSGKPGRVTAMAVSAVGQGALYVAGRGVGVLKSTDAGKTWVPISLGLPSGDVIALAAHSSVADTVYAVVAGQGIYRSEDGGKRWRMVDKGPQAELRAFIHSGMEGSMQSGWLFAATDKGVYRAMDCFCGFRLAGSLPGPVSAVAYDPKQPKALYSTVGKDVFSTANGGEDWQKAGSPGAEIGALAYSPSGGLYALLADGRVVHSRDKGRQWE